MESTSTNIFPQIVIALVIAAAIFFTFMVLEQLYKAYISYNSARVDVYPYTGNVTKEFKQDPNNPMNTTLSVSDNQLTGIEFTYATFIYVSDDTDSSEEGWKTLFYKGYNSSPFPLCGPGVFVSSSSASNDGPVLRVVMNTYDNWFNTIDVKQIPFNKWFHLALALRKNTLEVYVNGNLAAKKTFAGTLPYQNYQSLNLFPNNRLLPANFKNEASNGTNKHGIPPGENFIINGKAIGYISNMTYYRYAVSYSEIQAHMSLGPSNKFDNNGMDKPPYLIDTWWTQRKG
jgi:hypothetical protein